MKNMLVKLLSILLVLCFFASSSTVFASNEENGVIFTAIDKYILSSQISVPITIEATISLPKNFEGRGGVVVGNYDANGSACLNLEIHENGVPRLYIIDNNKKTTDVKFDKIDVREGKPVHIAITYDKTAKKLSAYKDGVLVQTVSKEIPLDVTMSSVLRLGGDYRQGNVQNFKGTVYGLAFWSDARSTMEINSDKEKIASDADSLIAAWDFSAYARSSPPSKVENIGTKTLNINYKEDSNWKRDSGFKGSFDFSFAVVGDTQIVTEKAPDRLHLLYDWIIDNAEKKKTKFVIGLGDITNRSRDWEWAAAKESIESLNGIVPYSIVRGNHDNAADYKETFTWAEYSRKVSGSYDGTMLNTYQLFDVNGIKFMLLNLDLKYTPGQIEWANQIVEKHSTYNVIVTTHIYLTADGNPQGANAMKYGAEFEAYELWDRLLKKHRNIVMIVCGHSPCDKVLVSSKKGDHGNVVRQVLVDPQGIDANEGLTGLVATFYFSNGGKKVNVDYYATLLDKYRSGSNISFYLDLLPAEEPETTIPDTTAADTTAVPDTTAVAPAEGGCGAFVGGGIVVTMAILGCAWVSKRR